jgi:hypothetical protein
MQACVKVGDGSRTWNLAMQRHLVYVSAALHRPVGELRVLLLEDPHNMYLVERDPVALRAS